MLRWLAMLLLGAGTSATGAPPDVPRLVDAWIAAGRTPGLAVGIIEPDGEVRMHFGGVRRQGDPAPLDEATLFEIGSVSKVLTTLLLARLADEGRVALSDPVDGLLPATVRMPVRGETPITLEHLATHTSGLARMPSNLEPADPANPYADYTVERLYDHLVEVGPGRAPGGEASYSNLGLGLLGHALALREGTTYESLLVEEVCRPLGMDRTLCTPARGADPTIASAHQGVRPVAGWDIPVLAGAGDVDSTLPDMMRFAAANLDRSDAPIPRALRRCHEARVGGGSPGLRLGLGWHVLERDDRQVVWHNGLTGGFAAFLGLEPRAGRAVVVLANSNEPAVLDLGLYLLDFADAPPEPYDPGEELVLADWLGTYRLPGQALRLEVLVEHDQPLARLTGQPAFAVFPAEPGVLESRGGAVRLVLEAGEGDVPPRVVLHQARARIAFEREPGGTPE